MRQLLKILLAASIIAFAASITAVSCGKTAAPNNNNGGGGTPTPEPQPVSGIVFENIDASVAELKDGNIELKASGFPTTAIDADIANTTLVSLATAPAGSLKRAFDITIKTDDVAATGGLVLVNTGDKANAFTLDAINTALSSYTGKDIKEGLRNSAPIATDAANAEAAKVGWNIYGGFMSDTAPTDAASAAANATPFAFTTSTSAVPTHPVLFCRTTVTTITDGGATGAGTAQDATVLTGGQKASCYVGATGAAFSGLAANDWLNAPAGNTFKKKFDVAVAGIATDAKTLGTMGLAGGAASLRDGLTTAEMTTLTTANPSYNKKFSVSLVKDPGFNYTPAGIKVTLVPAAVTDGLVKMDGNGNIKLNATSVGTNIGRFTNVGSTPAERANVSAVSLLKEVEANNNNVRALFTIELYKDPTLTAKADGGMLLITGVRLNEDGSTTNGESRINTNNITLQSTVASHNTASDRAIIERGIWRRAVSTAGANFYQIVPYVLIFPRNVNAQDAAAFLICPTEKLTGVHDATTASNTTKLPFIKATCYIGVYDFFNIAIIDDTWRRASNYIEAELQVMGFDTGMTGLANLSDATGWNKGTFFGALDNATIKSIIAKNRYGGKIFTIKLVSLPAFNNF